MRFFIPNQMVAALRENVVGRREFYCYAIVRTVALSNFFLVDPADFVTLPIFYRYFMVVILTTLISVWVAYYANNSGDGKQFWYRYFCTSFPISLLMIGISLVAVPQPPLK